MLFNSFEYLCFLTAILIISWIVVGFPRLRVFVLLLASYYFYFSNNGWQVFLIFFSTQVDYFASIAISDEKRESQRKLWLGASLLTNMGMLCYFKYLNFFADSAVDLAALVGVELSWVDLNVILPVGISFYTFQSMSYTIDVFRKEITKESSWINFMFYVSFFPQLIAGPIVRASQFLPQLDRPPRISESEVDHGLFRISRGLFKKIVLADFFAIYADYGFNLANQADPLQTVLGAYAFAFQIYFDFSGYSDIAIGSAALLGYKIPENFRQPYSARSLTDFWRRWHISLSSWLRDYVYISFGGNRQPEKWKVYRNLMFTMLLGGLWHGASWTFVIWGWLHGALLSLERLWRENRHVTAKIKFQTTWVQRLLVFNVVVLTWIPFRAESFEAMVEIFGKIANISFSKVPDVSVIAVMLLMVFLLLTQFLSERWSYQAAFLRLPIIVKWACHIVVWYLVILLNVDQPQPFIYFRF
jgi:alginate O-acetyltransferase complex protein AlgI